MIILSIKKSIGEIMGKLLMQKCIRTEQWQWLLSLEEEILQIEAIDMLLFDEEEMKRILGMTVETRVEM